LTQAIHAEAPEFSEMSVEQEILVTGIKVVDLLAPYAKGGKIGESTELFIPFRFQSVMHLKAVFRTLTILERIRGSVPCD
jgi:hypothetical protein